MTTHQDQPPLSRRALRQERSRAEEIDDSAEADRAPSGRRARAANPEGLVEVTNAEQASVVEQSSLQSPNHEPANVGPRDADSTTDEAANADSTTDEAASPESIGAEPTTSESTASEEAHTPEAPDAEATPVLTDSAIPKAFPFAGQVEATSDEAGHPGFRLRDFSPELSTARADSQSAHDWTPSDGDESVPLEYHTQGAPAFGYVSPYAEPVAAEPAPEPSFDSLFSDLLAPDADSRDAEDTDAQADTETDADAEVPAPDADIPVGEPIVVSEPVALVAPVEVAPEERTLSRREWRAMRAAAAAAEAESGADQTGAEDTPVEETPAEETPAAEAAPDAASEVELLFQEPEAAAPEAPESEQEQPAAAEAPSAGESADAVFIPPLVEPTAAPQPALSEAMAEFEALTRSPLETPAAEPAATAETSAPETPATAPAASGEASNTPFSFLLNPPASNLPTSNPTSGNPTPGNPSGAPSTSAAAPTSTVPAGETDSASYTPPIGHWSRQAELDDENQPFENTLSRDVGGGNVATTTNALVLPMIPQRDDFSSVLNATGEIMVTGTINLPGSVGTTGRDSRHYDDPEVDHLFDSFDNEVPNTDSAPVRAISAVSSHTATRGGIEPGRKQNNRVLTILLVTAGVMAVSVLGLLIAGFVFNIF